MINWILWLSNKTSTLQKGVCKVYWELCSVFSCFGHCNWARITSWWRWILESKKSFLFTREPFTKTSLSFATSVKVWKIRFNLYSLFFRVLKYLIFSCFSLHLVGNILIDWKIIFKNQERFFPSRTHSQKPLSVFAQVSRIERYGSFFETYFSEIRQIYQKSDFVIFSQLVESWLM